MRLLTMVLGAFIVFSLPLSAESSPSSVRLALLRQTADGPLKVCPEVVLVKPQDRFRLVIESPRGLNCWVLVQEDEGDFEILARPGVTTSFDEVLGAQTWVFPSQLGWFRPDSRVKRTRLVLLLSPSAIAEMNPWEAGSDNVVPPTLVSTMLRRALAANWTLEGQGGYNGSLRAEGSDLVFPKVSVTGLTALVFELK